MASKTTTAATDRKPTAAQRRAAEKAASQVKTVVNGTPDVPAASAATEPAPETPKRVNLTKAIRNQITEMHSEGKSVSQIASETGISPERVEAKIAEYTAAVAPAASKGKGGKPKKPSAFSREDFANAAKGVRLWGVVTDGDDKDLGVWGEYNFSPAVKAYEAANPEAKFAQYRGVRQSYIWLIDPKA